MPTRRVHALRIRIGAICIIAPSLRNHAQLIGFFSSQEKINYFIVTVVNTAHV